MPLLAAPASQLLHHAADTCHDHCRVCTDAQPLCYSGPLGRSKSMHII